MEQETVVVAHISQSEKKDETDEACEDGEVHSDIESNHRDGKRLASVIVDNRNKKENTSVVFFGTEKSSITRKIISLMRVNAGNEKYKSNKNYFESENKLCTILDASHGVQADIAVFGLSARKRDFEHNFDRNGRLYDYNNLERVSGIRRLVILIDDMDDKSVKWDEKRFNECKDKMSLCLKKFNFKDVIFIPCSVRNDIGVRKAIPESVCSWYKGPAFISCIDKFCPLKRKAEEEHNEDGSDVEEDPNPKARITDRQRRTVDLLTSRTGGAYIPPAKLRLLQAEITDKSSAAYQRIAWEALKKSIHGYINKVNVFNIAIITRELLKENIVRGRGLLCRSIIQAQTASPTFTHVYAALVAIINSKFPNIGELLLKRLIIQFKRAFRRNDKNVCLSASRFIAHLVNQRVAHEILALEILTLLVEKPTDDSVEVAISFLKECGMKLTEVTSKGVGAIFEMLKNILHEGKLEKRVQYMIEVIFQVRKDGFKDHQSVIEKLELVEEDDQFTHLIMLEDASDPQDTLNVFKFDEKYEANEGIYKGLSKEILGSNSDGSGSGGSGLDSDTDENDGSSESDDGQGEDATTGTIIDNTETNLIALRRTIYLTINSSLDYEECAHKLMKLQLKPGQEIELCHMFLDCCAEQRTYEKFFGLLAQRFCSINKIYIEPFEEIFRDTFKTTHRLDTNRLRNVSKFFAHLLFTDAISWDVLECIKLNEDDTTSSSRIFIKILFQELAEYMGLAKLNAKLKDEVLTESLAGLFPKDNPRNTRFSINFFTSIGLGGLTDELRQFLKTAPKSVSAINSEVLFQKTAIEVRTSSSSASSTSSSSDASSSDSSNDTSSSSTSSSNTSDDSDGEKIKKKKKIIKSDKQNNITINEKKKRRKSHNSSCNDNSSDSSVSVKKHKRTEHRVKQITYEKSKKILKDRKRKQDEDQYTSMNDYRNDKSNKNRPLEKSRKHTLKNKDREQKTEKENSKDLEGRERNGNSKETRTKVSTDEALKYKHERCGKHERK